jgi:hypothetical protein
MADFKHIKWNEEIMVEALNDNIWLLWLIIFVMNFSLG